MLPMREEGMQLVWEEGVLPMRVEGVLPMRMEGVQLVWEEGVLPTQEEEVHVHLLVSSMNIYVWFQCI